MNVTLPSKLQTIVKSCQKLGLIAHSTLTFLCVCVYVCKICACVYVCVCVWAFDEKVNKDDRCSNNNNKTKETVRVYPFTRARVVWCGGTRWGKQRQQWRKTETLKIMNIYLPARMCVSKAARQKASHLRLCITANLPSKLHFWLQFCRQRYFPFLTISSANKTWNAPCSIMKKSALAHPLRAVSRGGHSHAVSEFVYRGLRHSGHFINQNVAWKNTSVDALVHRVRTNRHEAWRNKQYVAPRVAASLYLWPA